MRIKKATLNINGKKVTTTGTRIYQTIKILNQRKVRGVSSLNIVPWGTRLSGYISDLRYIYGLDIETIMFPHDGGMHGRYFLKTPVTIERVEWLK